MTGRSTMAEKDTLDEGRERMFRSVLPLPLRAANGPVGLPVPPAFEECARENSTLVRRLLAGLAERGPGTSGAVVRSGPDRGPQFCDDRGFR